MKRLFMMFVVLCALQAVTVGAASFTDNGNGTVADSTTGLTWQQGEPGFMIWDNAMSYCEGLSLGGQSDWRLPNIDELKSIVDTKHSYPTIDTNYFPNANTSNYWSSTISIDLGFSKYPYYVIFSYGGIASSGFSSRNSFYVRCVANSQGTSTQNNCAATLSSDNKLHIPILTFNGQSYWADLKYKSGSNFSLSNAGAVTDTSSYSGCTAATISSSYKLHIPALTYNNVSYWADFQYSSTETVFTLTGAAAGKLPQTSSVVVY